MELYNVVRWMKQILTSNGTVQCGTMNESSTEAALHDRGIRIVELCIYSGAVVTDILGCGMLIHVLLHNRNLRDTSSVYFNVGFAISYILTGIFQGLHRVNFHFMLVQGYACLALASTSRTLTMIAGTMLFTLFSERYIAITQPLRYASIMTKKLSKAVLIAVIFYNFFLGFLPMLGWNKLGELSNYELSRCGRVSALRPGYIALVFAIYTLPLSVVFCLQCLHVCKIVRRQARQVHARAVSLHRGRGVVPRMGSNKGQLRLAGLFSGMFAAWIVFFALGGVAYAQDLGEDSAGRESTLMLSVLYCLLIIETASHPWIYGMSDKSIRNAIKNALPCLTRQNQQ